MAPCRGNDTSAIDRAVARTGRMAGAGGRGCRAASGVSGVPAASSMCRIAMRRRSSIGLRAPLGASMRSARSICTCWHFPLACARARCSARRRSCSGGPRRKLPHRGGALVRALRLGLPGGGTARVPRPARPRAMDPAAMRPDIGGNHGFQRQGRADHRRWQRHRPRRRARFRAAAAPRSSWWTATRPAARAPPASSASKAARRCSSPPTSRSPPTCRPM